MSGTLDLTIRRGTTFGPVLITCKDGDGLAFSLAGYKAYAHIRSDENAEELYLDLSPEIAANDAAGLITIPQLSAATTTALEPFKGRWDLILEDATGVRLTEPVLIGRVTVSSLITKP